MPVGAKLLQYTAQPVDAAEALRIGLVEAVSEDDDPLGLALEVAGQIAVNSPRAIRSVKQCVDRGLDLDLPAGLELERELWIDLIPDGDLTEGAAAFFDKRDPVYPDCPPGPCTAAPTAPTSWSASGCALSMNAAGLPIGAATVIVESPW